MLVCYNNIVIAENELKLYLTVKVVLQQSNIGEIMKIDRLIGIITLLLQHDKITAPELAERFEVSRRTINRDIDDICKAGIPLITTQGYGGGISISDGYKIEKSFFTNDELQAVITSLKGIDSVGKDSYSAKILDKLSAIDSRLNVDDTIIIDLASHYKDSLTEKIEQIKVAVKSLRKISFIYHSEKGDGVRILEPYKIVFKWSAWYVFGFCPERNDYRLFKLNRLSDLKVTNESFVKREVPTELLEFSNYFNSTNYLLKAIFKPSEKYRLIDEYGADCFSENSNGQLYFERDFVSYKNMREWVFSFGDKVTVLAPEKLRDDIVLNAKNILDKHDI